MRYIELNPVRAGMVSHPANYRWSSYGANAGHFTSSLLTAHAEYLALGGSEEDRADAYRALFAAALDSAEISGIRCALNGGFALGDSRFKHEVAAMLGRRVERGMPGRPTRKSKPDAEASHSRLLPSS